MQSRPWDGWELRGPGIAPSSASAALPMSYEQPSGSPSTSGNASGEGKQAMFVTHQARRTSCAQRSLDSASRVCRSSCAAHSPFSAVCGGAPTARTPFCTAGASQATHWRAARVQVSKLDTLAGLAVKYNISVRMLLSTTSAGLGHTCTERCSEVTTSSARRAGVGHQAVKRAAVGHGDVRQGHAAHPHARDAAHWARAPHAPPRAPAQVVSPRPGMHVTQ